ncbi:hypothetical protein BDD12DRAFT_892998 [Trichophaea hybrida]|nr:hypothetical protein BDD12DRAFT_892998 [Trichophaea hybrida]
MHLLKRSKPSSLKLKHILGQLGRSVEGALADRDLGAEILRDLRSQARNLSVVAAKDRRQLTKARVIAQEEVVQLREEREQKVAETPARAKTRKIKQEAAAAKKTVDHLFKWCKKWRRQQDTLWEKLRKKCKMKERGRVPMAQVFDTEEAEKAMLKFLTDTDVGRVAEA